MGFFQLTTAIHRSGCLDEGTQKGERNGRTVGHDLRGICFEWQKNMVTGAFPWKFSHSTIVCGHESLQLFVFQTLIPKPYSLLRGHWGGFFRKLPAPRHLPLLAGCISHLKKMGTATEEEFPWHSSTWEVSHHVVRVFSTSWGSHNEKIPHSHITIPLHKKNPKHNFLQQDYI